MANEFSGGDVNAVLKLVMSLSDSGDTQLSILTLALVTACRSCGVAREDALPMIADAFTNAPALVPIIELDAAVT
jgi:hypothetical protein